VYLAPCLPSLSHTKARKAATANGARGATLPGVERDMFARLMSAAFDEMAARSARVAELLTDADEARFTCPRGSDFTFDLRGRSGIPDDGDLTGHAAFGNLPCGEGFISPAGGSGTMVARTVGHIGLAEDEVTLTAEGGRLVAATGRLGEELVAHLDRYGEGGRHLAELGVGTNERAQLTGNLLEDEKILGTVHVAFGASASIGGTVDVPVHEDCVVVDPTLTIGGTTVVEAGRFVLA
jgi:leucyl aminopeptidase (aminopeptidase T)